MLILHLVASPEVLEARLEQKSGREGLLEYLLFKLEQIGELPYAKIDTTSLGTEAVADRIAAEVRAS